MKRLRIGIVLGLLLVVAVVSVASATTWAITYSKTNVSGSDFDIRLESPHAITIVHETSTPKVWAVASEKVKNPFLLDEAHATAVAWATEYMNDGAPTSDFPDPAPTNMAAYEQWLEYRFLECLAAGNCDY